MSSPFASILGTNYCPTDKEVLEIRGLLVGPTHRLKHLDDEIADLQRAIDKLTEERGGLSAYVEAHRALISPVRRLPLDVIQEIFIACLPVHRNPVMSATEAPVLLGRICSAWRSVSLSTPRLWARLHVVEPSLPWLYSGHYAYSQLLSEFDQKVAQRLEVTKMWLGRSGQCPLDISLYSPSGGPFQTPPEKGYSANAQFLRALIPFAARWHDIHFTIPPSSLLEIISDLNIDMPWLENVSFRHHYSHDDTRPDHNLDTMTCGSFKMLRGARVSSFSGSMFILERFQISWNQLTHLTIVGPPWNGLLELTSDLALRVISGCPALQSCRLMISDIGFAESPHPIVVLPLLHTLTVHCVSLTSVSPAVSVLLNHLFLPEMCNFTMLGSYREDSPPLADFFARSPRLLNIDISNNLFSKHSFLETLRSLPATIKRLTIRDTTPANGWVPPALDDDTLDVLALPGLCPDLQDLSIDYGPDLSDAAVLRFITAWMLGPGGTTLRRVRIQFHRAMTIDILPSLQPFVEAGLVVSLLYLPPRPSEHSPWKGFTDTRDVAPDWNVHLIDYL